MPDRWHAPNRVSGLSQHLLGACEFDLTFAHTEMISQRPGGYRRYAMADHKIRLSPHIEKQRFQNLINVDA